MKNFAPAVLLGLCLGGSALPALAQAPAAPVETISQIKPGLYEVVGEGGNVTVRTTKDGTIVVDTKNPGEAIFSLLMDRIHSVSPAPVKIVFNTHVHADHTGNNQRFLDSGAQVIGEAGEVALLAKQKPPANGAPKPAAPNVTYTGSKTVTLGGVTVEAHHYFRGHTSADTIVYFPADKVVCLGDDLTDHSPTLDYGNGASLAEWIKTLDAVLKLDFDVAIPGHGDKPMSKADVQAYRGKLATFLQRGKAAVAAGATKDDMMSKINIADLGWTFRMPLPAAQANGLYAEFSAK